MNRLFENSTPMPHTMSSERKLEPMVLRIFKDMRKCQKDIDFYVSRIKSARDRTVNLLEVLERIIEPTVQKKETSWSSEDWPDIAEEVRKMGIDPHGTNLLQASSIISEIKECSKDAEDSLKKILGAGTSPDITCYETMSPLQKLPAGKTLLFNGSMDPPESENLGELSKNCRELIERMEEPNGGMDI